MKFRAAKVQSNWVKLQKKLKEIVESKKDLLRDPEGVCMGFHNVGQPGGIAPAHTYRYWNSGKSYLYTGDQAILSTLFF